MKKTLGIITAISAAQTFFAYLGPAPGYETAFAALLIACSVSIIGLATLAIAEIRRKEKAAPARQPKNRHFYDISLKGERQI